MTLCARALTSRPTSGGAPQISLLVTSCHSIGLIIFMNVLHTIAYLVRQHQPSSSGIGRETHKIWSDRCSIRRRSFYRTDYTLQGVIGWGDGHTDMWYETELGYFPAPDCLPSFSSISRFGAFPHRLECYYTFFILWLFTTNSRLNVILFSNKSSFPNDAYGIGQPRLLHHWCWNVLESWWHTTESRP
jgi:hypothetical protein